MLRETRPEVGRQCLATVTSPQRSSETGWRSLSRLNILYLISFMSALKSDVKSVCYISVISGNDLERY